uniref:Glycosyltransferase involved in cell wall bisynthesis n=1 Tax=Candidatus Kentrum sp. TC TaxID=2126339 RepID=A0A450YHZ3_9GAMM|nr:MAG: Glycosyltransferase involved in cell wall bisynthesis [Candidatus Kentron sp. TC]
MRIVIDMQGAQTESRYRDIGRYARSFAEAVARNRGGHEILLALNGSFPHTIEPLRAAFDDLLPQDDIRVWRAPGPVREQQPGNDGRREAAELLREAFLASLRPDVIHVSSLFEGYLDDAATSIGCFGHATPVTVTLHDLIPLLDPKRYLTPDPPYAKYYRRKIAHLEQAKACLAISESSRREASMHGKLSEDRIFNISGAADSRFRPLPIEEGFANETLRKFGLGRPFVLYSGGADERKNLPRLIEAYAALPKELRKGHQLLLAGRMPEMEIAHLQRQGRSNGLESDELRFAGHVDDEELVRLYNLCALFVLPSWHEGFGLPALEAMACGAPVIGADATSLPEVIGCEEALFDPFDVAAMAAKMAQSLGDEAFRARLRAHGPKQAKKFSWDKTARRAITAWESLPNRLRRQDRALPPRESKPKLAFVSPLLPQRTGIAYYSAELLPALAEYYDIDVVVAQDSVDDPWVEAHGKARDVSWLRVNARKFDRVLYQFGNSPFHLHMFDLSREIPGTLVLHDFFVSGALSWSELHGGVEHAWKRALYVAHGYGAMREALQDREEAQYRYPVNFPILQHAQGVIVHSEYSKKLADRWYGEGASDSWEVIPHLRAPIEPFDRVSSREKLGIGKEDFCVCAFGFLGQTKLNHRLLECWLESALAGDKGCHLVFVGENAGGDYGARLLKTIRASGFADRIRLTGFVSPERFRRYLAAADMAVQLRARSRGETSGTILDCMNHGLPLIVNANGSMVELDAKAVLMLPDEFDDDALIRALETLWREPERGRLLGERAREIIRNRHSPEACARRYAEAIERFHRRAEIATPALIQAIASQPSFAPGDGELIHLSESISAALPLPRPAKRLFLDITGTYRHDLETGIERVARALLSTLLKNPLPGYRIEPVYLCDAQGTWRHRYARRYTLGLLGHPSDALDDEIAEPTCGDVLLTLDLSDGMLVRPESAGLFAEYRNKGVLVYSVVFDLLPVLASSVFPQGADLKHRQWLEAISRFDGAICISKAVAEDVLAWQENANLDWNERRPFRIGWFPLGADMDDSAPTRGLPDDARTLLDRLQSRPSFLMVGTIEPRKGYPRVIEAFDHLWRDGMEINLVIVGKEGWQGLPDKMRRDIPETIRRLRTHPERDRRLFWLEGVSDEYLERLYAATTCLIAASHGEGFGLPLIEAARHGLPILARDIPVFREVAGEYAYFFDADTPDRLAEAIQAWLSLFEKGRHPKSAEMPRLSWQESAKRLMEIIIDKQFQREKYFDGRTHQDRR